MGTCRGGSHFLVWGVESRLSARLTSSGWMPFRVRRRSLRDGSRGNVASPAQRRLVGLHRLPPWHSPFPEVPSRPYRAGPSCAQRSGIFDPMTPRDGPRELLCLLWPPSIRARSRGALALRGLPRALLHRIAHGGPPRSPPHLPAPGRARTRPPVAGIFPLQVAKPASLACLRTLGHCCRAGRRVAPRRVGPQMGRRASLRCHQ